MAYSCVCGVCTVVVVVVVGDSSPISHNQAKMPRVVIRCETATATTAAWKCSIEKRQTERERESV